MWGKIATGMMFRDDPKTDFFISFLKIIRNGLHSDDIILPPNTQGNIVRAFTALLLSFLQTDADSLFLLEDDVIFEPADLEALRNSGKDYDILSALFSGRRPPFNPQVFRSVHKSLNNIDNLVGIIDVEAIALGFCLIRREIIQKLADRSKGRIARWGICDACIAFCEDARIVGAKIGLNTDISVGHIARSVPVYWDKKTGKPELKI